MHTALDEQQLSRSLRLLNSVLTRVLRTQGQAGIATQVQHLQRRFAHLQRDGSPARRELPRVAKVAMAGTLQQRDACFGSLNLLLPGRLPRFLG